MAATNIDQRMRLGGAYPVAREVVTVTVLDEAATGETDITINGVTKQIIVDVPNLEDTDTATITLEDEDNRDYYLSSALAESLTHTLNVERALCGTTTVKITCLSTQTDGNKVFTIVILYL